LFVLGLWLVGAFALATVLTSVIAASLHRDELTDTGNESLSFLRLTLTGFFGVILVQTLSPLNLRWWVTALISVGSMFALLVGSQLSARVLGHGKVGTWLAKRFSGLVKSLDLLFTPLSLPKTDKPDEFEQELLESVDEFGETIVREVMVPRIDMASVQAGDTLAKAMKVFLTRGYSRLPVLGKNVDDVIGVLYLKDVTRVLLEDAKSMNKVTAADKARAPLFVPESKPVDDLLRQLQEQTTHIAIVVDEYGGVAGLVTMEDVIEEIVGEIADEYDRDPAEIEELSDGVLRVNAKCSLFDLGERFDLELEDEDVDSVGGLLAKELGRLPAKGDSVIYSGLSFTAERIEGRRKRLITVLVKAESALDDAKTTFEGEK
jgi:Mg2+/Co2+ transporter CorC